MIITHTGSVIILASGKSGTTHQPVTIEPLVPIQWQENCLFIKGFTGTK